MTLTPTFDPEAVYEAFRRHQEIKKQERHANERIKVKNQERRHANDSRIRRPSTNQNGKERYHAQANRFGEAFDPDAMFQGFRRHQVHQKRVQQLKKKEQKSLKKKPTTKRKQDEIETLEDYNFCWITRFKIPTAAIETPRFVIPILRPFRVQLSHGQATTFFKGTFKLPTEILLDQDLKMYLDMHGTGYHPSERKDKNKGSMRQHGLATYGSSVTAACQKFQFLNAHAKKGRSMLPRIIKKSYPGTAGWNYLHASWLLQMAQQAETIILECNPALKKNLLAIKKLIPQELRIGGTFLTGLSLVGDTSNGHNHPHLDNNDYVSLIVSVGHTVRGGDTQYYNADPKKNGTVVAQTEYGHGQFQCGKFEKVFHGASAWEGKRGVFSFYVNTSIYNHFLQFGPQYYLKAREKMYGKEICSVLDKFYNTAN